MGGGDGTQHRRKKDPPLLSFQGWSALVRLQEISSGSINKNSSKIEQNCRLFWDIFSSAMMNDLFMTFTSRLKVDAKCV